MAGPREPDVCATCTSFPAQEATEGDGSAVCEWKGRVRWDDRACGPLYSRVRNWYEDRSLDTRRRWIKRLMAEHPTPEETPT
jgi:hypothetical protein